MAQSFPNEPYPRNNVTPEFSLTAIEQTEQGLWRWELCSVRSVPQAWELSAVHQSMRSSAELSECVHLGGNTLWQGGRKDASLPTGIGSAKRAYSLFQVVLDLRYLVRTNQHY